MSIHSLIETINSFSPDNIGPIKIPSEGEIKELINALNILFAGLQEKNIKEQKKSEEEAFTLYTINYASKLISSTIDIQELLGVAIDTLIEIAQAEKGSLMLLNDDNSKLVVKVVKDKQKIKHPETRLKIEKNILSSVINESKPYFANDIKEFDDLGDGLGKDINSILSLPLMGKKDVIGVVNLYNRLNNKEFTQDDVNIISTLVTQTGANIENARLYKELEDWAKALEQKVAERTKELEEANSELRKIDQAKSDFLSTTAHELKTPLTSIKAIAITLLNNPDEDVNTRTEFLSLIDSEVDRLTRLINNTLNLAKIEAGKMDWDMRDISISDVIKTAIINTNPLSKKKKIDVNVNLPDKIPLIVGDHDKLIQVVTNLLSNAIKFTPEEGEIEVKVRERHHPEHAIQVSVSDTGVGIAREDLDKVFDKFKQVGKGKSELSGTGLGLTICKEIIEHHCGKIWVESEFEMGSTFHFTLPALKNGNEKWR
ncbi:MAG: GAF domain-containing sensor histidine kinase [bacterium]